MSAFPGFAISVHAPWAWALMYAGKDVENRSKSFPRQMDKRQVLGRVWVHASLWPKSGPLKSYTAPAVEFISECEIMYSIRRRYDFRPGDSLSIREEIANMRGHIVGSVYVEGYQEPDDPPDSPWYVQGSLAIMVRDPVPLQRLVPASGALGWWRPNAETIEVLKGAA